ncbi:MAG: hypothetical protein AAB361_03955 [Patescibacteria group bacterium]
MLLKLSVIAILFYFLALIQNSFFVHFNIFGAVPNFIFILFFILIFFSFSEKSYSRKNLFYSFVAGFFLDVFFGFYFGSSFALLLAISFIAKKILNSLKQKKDKYPFIHFAPLFLASLVSYEAVLAVFFGNISRIFLVKIIYSFLFAAPGFYFYKKLSNRFND